MADSPAIPVTPVEQAPRVLKMPVPTFRHFTAYPPTERRSFAGRQGGKSTVLCRISAELVLGELVLNTINTAVWLRENDANTNKTEWNVATPPAVNTRGEGIGLGAELNSQFLAQAESYIESHELYEHYRVQAEKTLARHDAKDAAQTKKVAAKVAASK